MKRTLLLVAVLSASQAALAAGSADKGKTAFAKHGFENTGTETLRLLGFFPAGAVVSWFEETIAPFGVEAFTLPLVS